MSLARPAQPNVACDRSNLAAGFGCASPILVFTKPKLAGNPHDLLRTVPDFLDASIQELCDNDLDLNGESNETLTRSGQVLRLPRFVKN